MLLRSEKQSPGVGCFLDALLEVVCAVLCRSEDVRETVAKECEDIVKFDLSPKENIQKCEDSNIYFYREAATKLRQLLRLLAPETTPATALMQMGWG